MTGNWKPTSHKPSVARQITLIALLSAVCYVGRILFSSIPNVQPVTVLLILFSWYLDGKTASLIAIVTMFTSNLLLGMGPWTLMQIATYLVIIIISVGVRLLCPNGVTQKKIHYRVIRALFAGGMGLFYGFMISIFSVSLYQVANFWTYYLRGIPYDLAHAGGNIAFYLLIEPVIVPLLKKII